MKYCLGLGLLAFFSNAYADNADVAARERYMKDFRSANKAIGRLLKANPADMAALSRQTADLQALADKPWPHYASPAATGEAKAAVWQQPQQFQAAIQRFSEATAALNSAAQQGNQAAAKSAFGQLGQSCKACHDTFRR